MKEKVGDEEAVRRVYLLALCRPPTEAEAKKFKALLSEAADKGRAVVRPWKTSSGLC